MSTTREELHRLVDDLPEPALKELAAIAREIERQVAAGEVEEVTDPEEIAIVLDAAREDPGEPEYTAEEAIRYLEERRRQRQSK